MQVFLKSFSQLKYLWDSLCWIRMWSARNKKRLWTSAISIRTYIFLTCTTRRMQCSAPMINSQYFGIHEPIQHRLWRSCNAGKTILWSRRTYDSPYHHIYNCHSSLTFLFYRQDGANRQACGTASRLSPSMNVRQHFQFHSRGISITHPAAGCWEIPRI